MKHVGKKALSIGLAAMLTLGTSTTAFAYEDTMPVTSTPPYVFNPHAIDLLPLTVDENSDVHYALPVEDGAETATVTLAKDDMPEALRTLTISAFGTALHIPAAVFAEIPDGASLQFTLADGSFTFTMLEADSDEFIWRDKVNAITAEIDFRAPMDVSTHQLVIQSNGISVTRSRYTDGKVIAAINQSGTYSPVIAGLGDYTDMQGHWAYTAVGYLTARGIVSGTIFEPQAVITRGDFHNMLIHAFGAIPQLEEGQSLQDVLTRGDIFMHVYGALENAELLPQVFTMQWMMFRDWPDDIESDAAVAFQNLAKMGVIRGNTQGCLNLFANATRAEAAQTLYTALQYVTAR